MWLRRQFRLELSVPKQVVVENDRLRLLYNQLFYGIAGFMLAQLIVLELWSKTTDVSHSIIFSLWTQEPAQISRVIANMNRALPPQCNDTRKYDFEFKDGDVVWSYVGYQCRSVCSPHHAIYNHCSLWKDLVIVDEQSVFFTTEQELTIWTSNSTGAQSSSVRRNNFFLPYEDHYSFTLMYSWNVNAHSLKAFSNLWLATGSSATSNHDAVTLMLDKIGNIRRRVGPTPGGIHLNVQELLAMAELAGKLDIPQEELGPNILKTSPGPVRRTTGLELTLELTCYEPNNVPSLYVDGSSFGVCTIQSVPASPMWVGRQLWHVDAHTMEQHTLHLHGIKVTIRTKMQARRFDLLNLLAWIVDAIVLLRLPKLILSLLLQHCCGRASQIYTRVLQEPFSFAEHICQLVVDVLSNSATYQVLKDNTEGISFKQLSSKLHQTMIGATGVGKGQADALALLGMSYARSKAEFLEHREQGDAWYQAGRLFHGSRRHHAALDWLASARNHALDARSFTYASSASREVSLHHLLSIIGNPHKLGFVERFVMPWSLRKLIKLSKYVSETQLAVDQSNSDSPVVVQSDEGAQVPEPEPSEDEHKTKYNSMQQTATKQERHDQSSAQIMERLEQLQTQFEQCQQKIDQYVECIAQQLEDRILAKLIQKECTPRKQPDKSMEDRILAKLIQKEYTPRKQPDKSNEMVKSHVDQWMLQIEAKMEDASKKIEEHVMSNIPESRMHDSSCGAGFYKTSLQEGHRGPITTLANFQPKLNTGEESVVARAFPVAQVGQQQQQQQQQPSTNVQERGSHETLETDSVTCTASNTQPLTQCGTDEALEHGISMTAGQRVVARLQRHPQSVSSEIDSLIETVYNSMEQIALVQLEVENGADRASGYIAKILDICLQIDNFEAADGSHSSVPLESESPQLANVLDSCNWTGVDQGVSRV